MFHGIIQIMATPEQRRGANHTFHDVTIDELQQLTDLHAQQVNTTEDPVEFDKR